VRVKVTKEIIDTAIKQLIRNGDYFRGAYNCPLAVAVNVALEGTDLYCKVNAIAEISLLDATRDPQRKYGRAIAVVETPMYLEEWLRDKVTRPFDTEEWRDDTEEDRAIEPIEFDLPLPYIMEEDDYERTGAEE
jgi:hypothetical protein